MNTLMALWNVFKRVQLLLVLCVCVPLNQEINSYLTFSLSFFHKSSFLPLFMDSTAVDFHQFYFLMAMKLLSMWLMRWNSFIVNMMKAGGNLNWRGYVYESHVHAILQSGWGCVCARESDWFRMGFFVKNEEFLCECNRSIAS